MRLRNLHWLQARRRLLRRSLTPAEAHHWNHLKKGSRLDGRKFRRQDSAGQYVLDFYCPSEKLAIELDGAAHDSEPAQCHDRLRDRFLLELGIRVLRFRNSEVMEDLEGVLSEIRRHFHQPRRYAPPLLTTP
jgi:very-short-patch-repair endonuclease